MLEQGIHLARRGFIALSIEITRECPLTCPGCYAYGGDHLGGDVTLRELQDFKGQQLVDAMFALLDKYKPQRDAYRAYIERTFGLIGTPNATAAADQVLAFETEIN